MATKINRPGRARQGQTGPDKDGQGRAGPARAAQDRVGKCLTMRDSDEQDQVGSWSVSAGQGWERPFMGSRTGQGREGQCKAVQGQADRVERGWVDHGSIVTVLWDREVSCKVGYGREGPGSVGQYIVWHIIAILQGNRVPGSLG